MGSGPQPTGLGATITPRWRGQLTYFRFRHSEERNTPALAGSDHRSTKQDLKEGLMEKPRGGRPVVGPEIKIRLPQELLAQVETLTKLTGVGRPEMIRRLIRAGLAASGVVQK